MTLDEDSFVGHFAELQAVALPVALKLKLVAAEIIERVIDFSSGQYILWEVDGEVGNSAFLVSDLAVDQKIILNVAADEFGGVVFEQLNRNLVLVPCVVDLQDVNV